MKKSIFDMSFTLPPMLVMTQVEKDMPTATNRIDCNYTLYTLVCRADC